MGVGVGAVAASLTGEAELLAREPRP
jgi:hypothetical protein